MFWTLLGTSTGIAESGTLEEFEQYIGSSRPAMLYFSRRPIDPSKIDIEQHKKLADFKKATLENALTGEFTDLSGLRSTLLRNLSEQIRALKTGRPRVDKIEHAARLTKLLQKHRDENISPEEFDAFREQIMAPVVTRPRRLTQ